MIITEKIIRDTLLLNEDDRDAYVLYGSYARGDYESSSDVDILRITTRRMLAPRLDGHVLLHIYDIRDLLEMAKQGSLFILHLIREAKPILDPNNYMREINAAFDKPNSYSLVARKITKQAITLLDVDESFFQTAPRQFTKVAVFICRTLVYAEHADLGSFSFSLRSLADGDKTASMLCVLKGRSSYSDFLRIRRAVHEKARIPDARTVACSLHELAQRSEADPLAAGLLRRIVDGSGGDGYVFLPNVNESHRVVA